MQKYKLNDIKKDLIPKYNITDMEEMISFKKANDFVADQFNAGWSHYYSFRDSAIMMGLADSIIKGSVKKKWVITYENIFRMMYSSVNFYETTPLYQKNLKKDCKIKNNFIDWGSK